MTIFDYYPYIDSIINDAVMDFEDFIMNIDILDTNLVDTEILEIEYINLKSKSKYQMVSTNLKLFIFLV